MKTARRLIDNPHVFDQVVVTLAGIIVLGAYVTAYAYVFKPQTVLQPTSTIGQSTVLAAWLVLVGVLFAEAGYSIRRGRTWDHALPEGYVGSLAAALVFGIAWLVPFYRDVWSLHDRPSGTCRAAICRSPVPSGRRPPGRLPRLTAVEREGVDRCWRTCCGARAWRAAPCSR